MFSPVNTKDRPSKTPQKGLSKNIFDKIKTYDNDKLSAYFGGFSSSNSSRFLGMTRSSPFNGLSPKMPSTSDITRGNVRTEDQNQQIRIQIAVNRYNGSTPKNSFFRVKTKKMEESPKSSPEIRYNGVGNFPTVILDKSRVILPRKQNLSSHLRSHSHVSPNFCMTESSTSGEGQEVPTAAKTYLDVLQDLSQKRLYPVDDDHRAEHSSPKAKRMCRGLGGGESFSEADLLYKPLFVSKSFKEFPSLSPKKDQGTQTSSHTKESPNENKVINGPSTDPKAELRRKLARRNNEILASLSSSIGSPFFKRKRSIVTTNGYTIQENTTPKRPRISSVPVSSEITTTPVIPQEDRATIPKKDQKTTVSPLANLEKDRFATIYKEMQLEPDAKLKALKTAQSQPEGHLLGNPDVPRTSENLENANVITTSSPSISFGLSTVTTVTTSNITPVVSTKLSDSTPEPMKTKDTDKSFGFGMTSSATVTPVTTFTFDTQKKSPIVAESSTKPSTPEAVKNKSFSFVSPQGTKPLEFNFTPKTTATSEGTLEPAKSLQFSFGTPKTDTVSPKPLADSTFSFGVAKTDVSKTSEIAKAPETLQFSFGSKVDQLQFSSGTKAITEVSEKNVSSTSSKGESVEKSAVEKPQFSFGIPTSEAPKESTGFSFKFIGSAASPKEHSEASKVVDDSAKALSNESPKAAFGTPFGGFKTSNELSKIVETTKKTNEMPKLGENPLGGMFGTSKISSNDATKVEQGPFTGIKVHSNDAPKLGENIFGVAKAANNNDSVIKPAESSFGGIKTTNDIPALGGTPFGTFGNFKTPATDTQKPGVNLFGTIKPSSDVPQSGESTFGTFVTSKSTSEPLKGADSLFGGVKPSSNPPKSSENTFGTFVASKLSNEPSKGAETLFGGIRPSSDAAAKSGENTAAVFGVEKFTDNSFGAMKASSSDVPKTVESALGTFAFSALSKTSLTDPRLRLGESSFGALKTTADTQKFGQTSSDSVKPGIGMFGMPATSADSSKIAPTEASKTSQEGFGSFGNFKTSVENSKGKDSGFGLFGVANSSAKLNNELFSFGGTTQAPSQIGFGQPKPLENSNMFSFGKAGDTTDKPGGIFGGIPTTEASKMGSFSFGGGQPSATTFEPPKAEASKGFSFGGTTIFPTPKPETSSNPTASGFSFGAASASSEPKPIAFGTTTTAESKVEPAKPTFSFAAGGVTQPFTFDSTKPKPLGFQQQQQQQQQPPQPLPLSFGASSNVFPPAASSNPTPVTSSNQAAFSFGSSQPSFGFGTSAATTTTTTTGFSFNLTPTTTAFSFNTPTTSSTLSFGTANTAAFVPKTTTAPPAFGAATSFTQQPLGGFGSFSTSFSSPQSTPQNPQSPLRPFPFNATPSSNSTSFSFNANTENKSASQPFKFGSGSASSSGGGGFNFQPPSATSGVFNFNSSSSGASTSGPGGVFSFGVSTNSGFGQSPTPTPPPGGFNIGLPSFSVGTASSQSKKSNIRRKARP